MIATRNQYNFEDIAKIIKGDIIQNPHNFFPIVDLLTDSRKISRVEDGIFFAIITKRNDGHKYIPELYLKGVRNYVVSYPPDNLSDYPEAGFILVKNTLKALQSLSAYHRKQFNVKTVGITGSNGKTIVKEWLYQLLCDDYNIVKNPKSYNSQIGVPLSVWQINSDHDLAIFEAGISEPDEMDKLQAIIQPNFGIFTNIGQAHDENFIHREQKISEKLKLFTKVETLIYCTDYLEIKERILKFEILKNIPAFTWSKKNKATLQITNIVKDNKKASITALYNSESISVEIPFTDEASIENVIHCWAFLLYIGKSNSFISERMKLLHPIAMRLELKEGINNCSIINDSYSSDLNSLNIAIDFLNQQKQHKKKTVILSDILQSGRDDNDLYAEIGNLLKSKGIDRIIGIGKSISKQADKFSGNLKFYPSTEAFLEEMVFSDFSNETILLKGARVFEFERIVSILQQKAHETVLEIDLNALIHNLNFYRSKLKPETKVMAMVKAFSYGSGSYEIANTLQFHRVDYLAVAYADEGVELRKAGINLPIMVMNPDEQSIDSIIKYNLEPEIYSFRILSLLEDTLQHYVTKEKIVDIHIKLDTGMHRLGFLKDEINELVKHLSENNFIRVKSVFSHLAASENPDFDYFSRQQIELFEEMSNKIITSFSYPILRHILNTSGCVRFPEAHYDMVRLGIGLYGISADNSEVNDLHNVGTLKTIISQIKNINANETVGYGRKFIAEKDMKIAVIPIGYADGLNRKYGNGKGKVLINNKFVPIIGNICMDMCMIDVTDVDAKENDEVIIFGKELPITEMAEILETIPYEILTGISRRVKRVFYQE
jgi:alanine racemase